MILVTGGAGYIGSLLTQELVKRKIPTRILDSFIFGKQSIEKFKNKIEIVKGDIRNPPKGIFKDITTVIHLAGLSNDPTANFDPQTNYQINTVSTINLANLAKQNKVKRFIFGSSCSIYDQGLKKRQIIQDENSFVNPIAPYSLSKLKAEKGILPLADDKFTVVVVRKGTVFGYSPRMRYDLVVNTMIKDALQKGKITVLAEGKQWRPLISINDVACGYIKLLKTPKQKINKEIFNLLTDNFRIIDIAKKVKKAVSHLMKVDLQIEKAIIETRSYKVSNKKMQKVLKFFPKDTIEDFVSEMVKKELEDFDNPKYYNIQWMKLLYQKGKYF